jgi:hypothetical protein
MGRIDNRTVLTDAVAQFQAEVQRLALAAVRAIIQQELERRPAEPELAAQRKRKPGPKPRRKGGQPTARQLELAMPKASEPQLELPLVRSAASDTAGDGDAATEAGGQRPPGDAGDGAAGEGTQAAAPVSPGSRKRVPWTRDTIVSELATWMLSGTAIDAQFMTRHGPRGLVAAIRRIFGRFDAAMNVAALHVSKLYPDGPPSRRMS